MPRPTSTVPTQLLIAYDTHAGARGKQNEDCFDVFEVPLPVSNGNAQRRMTVAVVADGVTSRTGGAQASQLAVKTVRAFLEKGLADGPRPKQLEESILRANREIHTFAQTNAIMESMSTTMVLAAVEEQRLYALHVGDSRAYLIRGNAVYQLTLDHTWVQKAIDEGRISVAEAKVHPNRHVIVRYLGIDQRVTIDQEIIIPDTTQPNGQRAMGDSLSLKPGDAILLCTDGLTDQVKEHEIGEAVRKHWLQPQAAVKELIDTALKRQEPDNITVVLIELPDGTAPLPTPFRKPLPLLVGIATVLVVSVFLFGGSLMSNMGLQSAATPQPVAIANTAAQALATATPPPPPAPTATTPPNPATPTSSVPTATVTPTALATLANTPLLPTATLGNGGAALAATATTTPTVLATRTGNAAPPLGATATLAPSPTPTPTFTPSPTPVTTVRLVSPLNREAVTDVKEFQWNVVNSNANATGFLLQISPADQPNTPNYEQPVDIAARRFTVDLNSLALVDKAIYSWRILLVNATGTTIAASSAGEFSYDAPTPTPTPTLQPQPQQQSGGGNNNENKNSNNGQKDPGGP